MLRSAIYHQQNPEPRNTKLITLNPKHPLLFRSRDQTRVLPEHPVHPGVVSTIQDQAITFITWNYVVSLTKHQALSWASCSWQHEWTSKLHRWLNVYNLCSSLLSITCTWLPVKRFMIKHTACNHAIIYPHYINKGCLYTTQYRPVLMGNQLAQQVWSLHET
jgi:hypothetical protein